MSYTVTGTAHHPTILEKWWENMRLDGKYLLSNFFFLQILWANANVGIWWVIFVCFSVTFNWLKMLEEVSVHLKLTFIIHVAGSSFMTFCTFIFVVYSLCILPSWCGVSVWWKRSWSLHLKQPMIIWAGWVESTVRLVSAHLSTNLCMGFSSLGFMWHFPEFWVLA